MWYWIKHFTEFVLFAWAFLLSIVIIVGLPILVVFAILKALGNNQ